MYQRLIKTAAFSTPIMALYAIMPIFIFRQEASSIFLKGFLFLMLFVSAAWSYNILILKWLPALTDVRRIALSNLLAVLIIPVFIQIRLFFLGDIPFPKQEYVYPFVMSLSLNAIILIIIHSILMREKKQMADLEVARLKMANMEAQQSILMQQFQPHFVFNALSTLKSLIRTTPKEAESYLLKLSNFLRFSIKANRNLLVTLDKELEFAQAYIEMQQIRFNAAIFCEIDLPAELRQQQIPVFALQSLVENAIKG